MYKYTHIYRYICIHVCVYIYVHIYIHTYVLDFCEQWHVKLSNYQKGLCVRHDALICAT